MVVAKAYHVAEKEVVRVVKVIVHVVDFWANLFALLVLDKVVALY